MSTIQTRDGCSLFYEDQGEGEAIVFVHEFGGDYRSWTHQVAHFEAAFRCITYSARGFKPSSVPAQRSAYGQAQASADLLALLDGLGLEAVHLVGASMGSFTSLDFALDHAGRVRSLTLVGISSGPRDEEERETYRSGWVTPEVRRREAQREAGAVSVLEEDPAYRRFQSANPESWRRYVANLREQSVSGALHVLQTLHWNRRSLWKDRERLANLSLPVLLVMGDEDYYLVDETNRFLNDVVPDSRLHVFAGTGHLVNIENARSFNELLHCFLEGLSKTPGCSTRAPACGSTRAGR